MNPFIKEARDEALKTLQESVRHGVPLRRHATARSQRHEREIRQRLAVAGGQHDSRRVRFLLGLMTVLLGSLLLQIETRSD